MELILGKEEHSVLLGAEKRGIKRSLYDHYYELHSNMLQRNEEEVGGTLRHRNNVDWDGRPEYRVVHAIFSVLFRQDADDAEMYSLSVLSCPCHCFDRLD